MSQIRTLIQQFFSRSLKIAPQITILINWLLQLIRKSVKGLPIITGLRKKLSILLGSLLMASITLAGSRMTRSRQQRRDAKTCKSVRRLINASLCLNTSDCTVPVKGAQMSTIHVVLQAFLMSSRQTKSSTFQPKKAIKLARSENRSILISRSSSSSCLTQRVTEVKQRMLIFLMKGKISPKIDYNRSDSLCTTKLAKKSVQRISQRIVKVHARVARMKSSGEI